MPSARKPCSCGITAPPKIAITSRLDALAVMGPKPSMLSVKSVGNMMELKNPTAITLHIASAPRLRMVLASSAIAASAYAHRRDRKSTRLNSSHEWISYAVFCLKKKKAETRQPLSEARLADCNEPDMTVEQVRHEK